MNVPGQMMKAYSAFYRYSLGNMLLALGQCERRGLEIGPINTFQGWQAVGRRVRKGERALFLCMPITVRRSDANRASAENEKIITAFVYKPRWFTLSQTEGEAPSVPVQKMPIFDAERALAALGIELIAFKSSDGNLQGYAKRGTRQIAISPIAGMPHKTFFHETAHVVLGHTAEGDNAFAERLPKNLREVEAESVALLCCESLGLDGAQYCRAYIQHWLGEGEVIPDQSAQKIFRAADAILKAGAPPSEQENLTGQSEPGERAA